jgi:hypothetical protein
VRTPARSLFGGLIALSASTTAAVSPADLTAAEARRLAAGETIVRMAAAPAVEGWAARELAVPAERVARAVADWRHYDEFFPFVERSEAAVEDGAVITRQRLDPPGPAPRRELAAATELVPPPPTGDGPRTWRIRWQGIAPEVADERGEWTVREIGPGRTRVEIRLAGGLGLPGGLGRSAVGRMLPWVLDGLAQQVGRCRYDRPVHPTCGEAPAFVAPAEPSPVTAP